MSDATVREVWVGDRYNKGFFLGKRVLVLGESHYEWEGRDIPTSEMTIYCVKTHIQDRSKRAPVFWRKIDEMFFGYEPTLNEKEELWSSLAFTNYVARVLEDRKSRPTLAMWRESEEEFKRLLMTIRPNFVLVLGRELWTHLPPENTKGPEITGAKRSETCYYTMNELGSRALAYSTDHPSYRFFGKASYWHPYIMEALNLAPSWQ